MSTGVGKTVAPSVLEFPVLWVDDHEEAVASFKSTIEAWFTTNYTGADLRMEHAISAADALAKVKASYFDLLIVDYNLPDGQNGSDLVKELRNQGVYTDIIFYTRRAQMPPDVATEVSKGGFALVVPDRDLASTSQAVIKDRLERFGKVSFLRGIVISMFIEVESELNKFLMSYFEINENRQDHFRSSILENSTISFRAKLNALLMITFGKLRAGKKDPIKPPFGSLDYEKIMSGVQMLRKMEESRNNLAHCVVRPNERLEVFAMGETVCYDRKDVVSILMDMRKCLNFIATLSVCLSSNQSAQGA